MSFLLNFSQNVTDSIVRAGINAAVTFTQTCASKIQNTQTVTLKNCKFQAKDINISNVGIGLVRCASDTSNAANIQNVVEEAIHQAAETAKQQLGLLNLGQAAIQASQNITKTEVDLATAITFAFTQTCTSEISSSQNVVCENSEVVLGDSLNLTNYQTSIVECTFKAVSKTDAYNRLKEEISQSAVAKEESAFSIYIVIFLVIIAIVAILAINRRGSSRSVGGSSRSIGGASNGRNWSILGMVVILSIVVISYCYYASSNRLWPFQ